MFEETEHGAIVRLDGYAILPREQLDHLAEVAGLWSDAQLELGAVCAGRFAKHKFTREH